MIKRLSYWLPPIIWALIIFKLSSGSLPKVGPSYWWDFSFKKLSHVFFYAVLGVLMYRALVSENVSHKRAVFISIVFCFLYGISDEFHQSFSPTREPKIRDIVFDTIGGGIGSIWARKYL